MLSSDKPKNLFTACSIRNILVEPGLVLSPMSGVTTSAFRRLIKILNPGAVGLVVSEFISVEALTRKVERSILMMKFRELERPFGVQIFGYDTERVRDAALMAEDSGADLVDINCGCPAPKVVRKGGGCELMRQPQHLAKMLREVKRPLSVPLTVKIRSGWDEKGKNALQIAKICESEGAESLAVHGRTRTQMYRGESDWQLISEVAKQLSIPVFGSGDVDSFQAARERLCSDISGLYIGRAAMRNPFVFSDILHNRDTMLSITAADLICVLELYISLLLEDYPASSCVGKIKQLVSQMCRGYEWRKRICMAKDLGEIEGIIAEVRAEARDFYKADSCMPIAEC